MAAPLRIYDRTRRLKPAAAGGETGDPGKELFGKLVKLIPGEVIGLYLAVAGPIPKEYPVALVVVSLLCLLAVVVARAWQTADPVHHKPPQWGAVGISCLAFAIWLYSIGGPFAAYGLQVPWVATALVAFFVFFIPYLYKGDPSPPPEGAG